MYCRLLIQVEFRIRNGGRFVKGQSGNIHGKPKGIRNRNRISELAITVFTEDFAVHGKSTLERLRRKDVYGYMQLVLRLIPKEHLLKLVQGDLLDYSHMSYDEVTPYVNERRHGKRIERIIERVDEDPFKN